jgi:hypothetical protein
MNRRARFGVRHSRLPDDFDQNARADHRPVLAVLFAAIGERPFRA